MPFQRTATINASPKAVFETLVDLSKASAWMPAIQKIERAESGPLKTGSTWKETRLAGKRQMQADIKVVDLEPAKKLGLEVDSKMMAGRMRFDLAPDGKGTQVRYEADMWGKGVFKLMGGMMNRAMAKEDDDLLVRLKNQVEKKR